MKNIITTFSIFFLVLGIGCNQSSQKQGKRNNQTKQPEKGGTLTHAATYKNLQVFFINRQKTPDNASYLPLSEAMEKGIAKVNETGEVSNLSIENLSDDQYVFVNAGDIVKGGKQDRYLVNSLIVPPKSGKVNLASFCVEAGRWAQRGNESTAKFSSSYNMASSGKLRLAAQYYKNQSVVWNQVAQHRVMLNVATMTPAQRSALNALPNSPESTGSPLVATTQAGGVPSNANPSQTSIDPATGLPALNGTQTALSSPEILIRPRRDQVAALQAYAQAGWNIPLGGRTLSSGGSTSLQLALENPKVKEQTQEYVSELNTKMAAQSNPVGAVFAINGKVVSADIYGNSSLFKSLWPKLINGAAAEAMAKFDDKQDVKNLNEADFKGFLSNETQDNPSSKKLNDQTQLTTTKGNRHILFETHDERSKGQWIHRSYLATPKK